MSLYLTPRHFARIATVGFIVLIAGLAVVQSRRGEDPGIIAPLELEEVHAFVSELTRCRTVTLNEIASLENCRRVWADHRRQFFGPSKTLPSSLEPTPTAATPSGKIQDRISPIEAEHQPNEAR